ncbi:hypothetical protein PHEL85_3451 [Polaribacter sp. Hel1_85]|nr:hypothetical protein PHEL85_3451 [Polaribacter sp. Hel1_85]
MKKRNYLFLMITLIVMINCSTEEQINSQPSIIKNITYNIDYPNITFNWDKSIDPDGDNVKYLVSIVNWTDAGNMNDYILEVYPKDPTYETNVNSLTIELNEIGVLNNSLQKYTIFVFAVEDDFTDYSLLYSELGNFSENYFLNNYLTFIPLSKGVHKGNLIITDHIHLEWLKDSEIHTLNGDLILNSYCTTESFHPYKINNLKNLKGLKTINGNLIIGLERGYGNTINQELAERYNCHRLGNNFSFNDLEGLEDLVNINGDLLVAGTSIKNLNDFKSLVKVEGKIGFYNNLDLKNFCGLTDLFKLNNFEIYNNGYNPNLNDFSNGNCNN